MNHTFSRRLLFSMALVAALLARGAVGAAEADDLAPLRGQTIRLIIAAPVGGSNDKLARLFGQALGAALPDASVRMQNIEGGSGALGAKEIHEAAGNLITIGLIHAGPVYSQIMAEEALPYDLSKFHWIGALTTNQRFLGVHKSQAPIDARKPEQKKKRLVYLVPTAGSPGYVDGMLVNAITQLRLKVVPGFKQEQQDSMFLAGEADAVIASFGAADELVESGELVPLFRFGDRATPPALSTVPSLSEIARPGTDPEVLAVVLQLNDINRFIVAAPATAPDKVQALRAAFETITTNEAYARAVGEAKLVHSPTNGATVEENFRRLLGSESSLKSKLKAYLECGKKISDEAAEACE